MSADVTARREDEGEAIATVAGGSDAWRGGGDDAPAGRGRASRVTPGWRHAGGRPRVTERRTGLSDGRSLPAHMVPLSGILDASDKPDLCSSPAFSVPFSEVRKWPATAVPNQHHREPDPRQPRADSLSKAVQQFTDVQFRMPFPTVITERCLRRSARPMSRTSNAQPAPGRHAEGNSAFGVALSGMIDRRLERPTGTTGRADQCDRTTPSGLADRLARLDDTLETTLPDDVAVWHGCELVVVIRPDGSRLPLVRLIIVRGLGDQSEPVASVMMTGGHDERKAGRHPPENARNAQNART
jgi:hypothetical protein